MLESKINIICQERKKINFSSNIKIYFKEIAI